ncbi:MAG: S49 family peptidase [Rickettsiaceae bacterium]|nr:MAG: S49 family peptidase [Rickettsiaceae bacterium]
MIGSKIYDSKFEQLLSYLPFGSKKHIHIIAVLKLHGVISAGGGFKASLNLDNLNENIEKAFKIPKLAALCLSINSPGGSPVQSELIAKRIRTLAKDKKIPVYSFVEDVAASGGYWLACAGDKIYASNSSIIGSIGVVSSSFGFQEAIAKLGVERRLYTEGKNKSILDPFMPVRNNDIKIIKQLQKQIHVHFIEYVKERRAGQLTQNDDILFNGEFWAGTTALDFGLIDGITDLYSFIRKQFGEDTKIEYLDKKQSWLRRKLRLSIIDGAEEFSDILISKTQNLINSNKYNFK